MYNLFGNLCPSIHLVWKITTGDLSSHIKLSHLLLQIRSPKPLPSPPAFVSLNAERDRISTLLMVLISACESNSMAILEANLRRERTNPCWALRSVAGNTLNCLSAPSPAFLTHTERKHWAAVLTWIESNRHVSVFYALFWIHLLL